MMEKAFLPSWQAWARRIKLDHDWRSKLGTILAASEKTEIELCFPFLANPLRLRGGRNDLGIFDAVFMKGICNISVWTSRQPEVIVDAGAHVGLSAIFFAHLFPASHILAIEPEKGNFDLLLKNTANYDNIAVMRAGLWGMPCSLMLKDPMARGDAFQTVPATDGACTIPGITMSQVIDHLKKRRIGLLKLDVEGAERDIFSHESMWLKQVDSMLIETHDRSVPGGAYAVSRALYDMPFQKFVLGDNELFLF